MTQPLFAFFLLVTLALGQSQPNLIDETLNDADQHLCVAEAALDRRDVAYEKMQHLLDRKAPPQELLSAYREMLRLQTQIYLLRSTVYRVQYLKGIQNMEAASDEQRLKATLHVNFGNILAKRFDLGKKQRGLHTKLLDRILRVSDEYYKKMQIALGQHWAARTRLERHPTPNIFAGLGHRLDVVITADRVVNATQELAAVIYILSYAKAERSKGRISEEQLKKAQKVLKKISPPKPKMKDEESHEYRVLASYQSPPAPQVAAGRFVFI